MAFAYFIFLRPPHGLTWTAVGLSVAVFLSEVGGLIYLITIYKSRISTRVFEKPTKAIVKRLFFLLEFQLQLHA